MSCFFIHAFWCPVLAALWAPERLPCWPSPAVAAVTVPCMEASPARESLWSLAKPALGFANYDFYAPSFFDLLLSTLLMFICLFIIEVFPYLPMTETIRFRKNVVSPWYLWFHINLGFFFFLDPLFLLFKVDSFPFNILKVKLELHQFPPSFLPSLQLLSFPPPLILCQKYGLFFLSFYCYMRLYTFVCVHTYT